MRILVLAPHPFYQHRGTPIAVRFLIQALVTQGHEIDVLTYHEGEDIEVPNCTVHRIPSVPGIRNVRPGFSVKKLVCDVLLARACLQMLSKKRYDVVHAVEESGFIALAVKWLFKVPFVYDMDSSLPQQMMERFAFLRLVKWPMEASERLVVRGSAGVVAVCKALEEVARGYDGGKPILRLEDPSLLSIDCDQGDHLDQLIESKGPIAMYVGNLEPYQGVDLLFAGFRHAAAQDPTLQLVVIGGNDDHIEAYRKRAAQWGLEGSIHLIGPRPIAQLGWYLRQADVLVSPRTMGRNTPMKIYSYLDSGVPVLATDLPTHTQVLDTSIAYLVAPNPREFGEGLLELMRNAQLRATLARQARERVQQEFSPEAYHRKLTEFYESMEPVLVPARRAS